REDPDRSAVATDTLPELRIGFSRRAGTAPVVTRRPRTRTPARPRARVVTPKGVRFRRRMADTAFRGLVRGLALSVLLMTALIAVSLLRGSWDSIRTFGWSFLWTSTWDPVFLHFGALPFIFGTIASSAIAIAIAIPLGLGAAICLAELLPQRIAEPLTF